MPADLGDLILAAYQQLGANSVAVRSSGTAEDLEGASFAGQHDTFLNVAGPDALLSAVRACWASLWSPRAVEYRGRQGWKDGDVGLAVIVQTMVPAEWAGVLFTADPVSGRRDRLIVEAVAGLGEALVSGQTTGERWVVERPGLEVRDDRPSIAAGGVEALAGLGIRIEAAFGRPQDIEWAYAQGQIQVLQARPLTALPPEPVSVPPTHSKTYTRLQHSLAPNAVDHLPVPPYPLDQSLFFRPLFERLFRSLDRLGFVLPPADEVLVEVADGVIQMIPPTGRPTLKALALPVHLLRALQAKPEDWLEQCRRTLARLADETDREDVSGLSEPELIDRIDRLSNLLVDLSVSRFVAFPRGMLRGAGLGLMVRLATGGRAAEIETQLLAGIPCSTTAANRELQHIASQIGASEDVRQMFLAESPNRLPARLDEAPSGRSIRAQVDGYLSRFGRRETIMPSAALPAWRDDPTLVYGLLQGLMAGALEPDGNQADKDRQGRAVKQMINMLGRKWLGFGGALVSLFRARLDAQRQFIAFREDSHFYLFTAFPVVRRLALELGHRLVGRGALDKPDDVFFLKIEEIKSRHAPAELRHIAGGRKRARESAGKHYTTVPAELLEQALGAGELQGSAVSPGQAVGPARIILGEHDFRKLQKGDVLVAPYTNPTWTPLFSLASAVVVDAGGAASHAAIVAREVGIPAVMGTRSGTARLHDGQRVLVDGSQGRVVPLDNGAGQA